MYYQVIIKRFKGSETNINIRPVEEKKKDSFERFEGLTHDVKYFNSYSAAVEMIEKYL